MNKENIKIVKLSQASSLAKIISNKTAQQIIELIGNSKKATASQIAKKLKLPASTVHYNIKALVKGGIVDDSQFTYSQKGKTIIHYTLTNHILVIIPASRDEFSVLNSIKALVPSILGVGVIGLAYSLFSKTIMRGASNSVVQESLTKVSMDEGAAAPAAFAAEGSADMLVRTTSSAVESTANSTHEFLWGLLIATFILVSIFLVRNYLLSRKNKK